MYLEILDALSTYIKNYLTIKFLNFNKRSWPDFIKKKTSNSNVDIYNKWNRNFCFPVSFPKLYLPYLIRKKKNQTIIHKNHFKLLLVTFPLMNIDIFFYNNGRNTDINFYSNNL